MYIFLFFSTTLDWCKPYICGEPDQQFSGLLQKDDLQRRKSWFFNYRAISHISLWALPSGKYLLILMMHTAGSISKDRLISDLFSLLLETNVLKRNLLVRNLLERNILERNLLERNLLKRNLVIINILKSLLERNLLEKTLSKRK